MIKDKWKTIHDAIDQDIRNGILHPGDQLPPEPELAQAFQTGRHSVRRAISELAKDGKLSVEQGRGTFVAALPRLIYTIGKRTRLRSNLAPQDQAITRESLCGDIVPAPEKVAAVFGVEIGAPMVRTTYITLAGDTPINSGTAWHDATRFPDFLNRRDALGSVTPTYKSYGIEDYVRRETEIYSRRASADEARRLRQHPDQPVMVVRAVDTEINGTPLGYSDVIWSSVRVRFVIPLQQDGDPT